jgi:hypothetical protein
MYSSILSTKAIPFPKKESIKAILFVLGRCKHVAERAISLSILPLNCFIPMTYNKSGENKHLADYILQ